MLPVVLFISYVLTQRFPLSFAIAETIGIPVLAASSVYASAILLNLIINVLVLSNGNRFIFRFAYIERCLSRCTGPTFPFIVNHHLNDELPCVRSAIRRRHPQQPNATVPPEIRSSRRESSNRYNHIIIRIKSCLCDIHHHK